MRALGSVVVGTLLVLGMAGVAMWRALVFLPWLTALSSPGHRLAAVSFLEVKASRQYLPWLEQRLEIEKPFIGYHAAQALRHAGCELPVEDLPLVKTAMENALKSIADQAHDSDRANTLLAGLEEVRKRAGA